MKVIRAKSAGFCWGVERAIQVAREQVDGGRRTVYTDGPLIHNNQMMTALSTVGVREVGDYQSSSSIELDDDERDDAVVVVRAHGISPERRKYLQNLDLPFKDATCPDVGIIAGKIRMHATKGYDIVIFGDPLHPEVIGLIGYADGRGHAVQTEEDLNALPDFENGVVMVSQSTMFTHEFEHLSALLAQRYSKLVVFDTICGATKERQSDLRQLVAEGAEAIVVIGGHHSANTCKLAKLAESHNRPTFHVETPEELDPSLMSRFASIGVTAGASTPEFIIDAVCRTLESIEPSSTV